MQNKYGFTLIEIVVALVILGIIILIGIQVPNKLLKKHKNMEADSDIYSDVMMINESLGKDIQNITSRDSISIEKSTNNISYIDMAVNKNNQDGLNYGIETVNHRYSFKKDGVYRSILKNNVDKKDTNSKRITHQKFYILNDKDDDLLILGIKESSNDDAVIDNEPKVLLKYNLKGNSLQQNPKLNYFPSK